ncbi:hypothetical protein BD779DRAFT_1476639 [Infundibulicybe gibba]|nr:hypothetical protein BD779DRAFT_1476639 [Infundibulicybe gibba]
MSERCNVNNKEKDDRAAVPMRLLQCSRIFLATSTARCHHEDVAMHCLEGAPRLLRHSSQAEVGRGGCRAGIRASTGLIIRGVPQGRGNYHRLWLQLIAEYIAQGSIMGGEGYSAGDECIKVVTLGAALECECDRIQLHNGLAVALNGAFRETSSIDGHRKFGQAHGDTEGLGGRSRCGERGSGHYNGPNIVLRWFKVGCGRITAISSQPGGLVSTWTTSNWSWDAREIPSVVNSRWHRSKRENAVKGAGL